MRIDEGRRQHEALALDHAVAVRLEVRTDLGDDTAVDPHVADRVDLLDRIEHARAADDEVVPAPPRLDVQHQATSSGSGDATGTGPVVSRS